MASLASLASLASSDDAPPGSYADWVAGLVVPCTLAALALRPETERRRRRDAASAATEAPFCRDTLHLRDRLLALRMRHPPLYGEILSQCAAAAGVDPAVLHIDVELGLRSAVPQAGDLRVRAWTPYSPTLRFEPDQKGAVLCAASGGRRCTSVGFGSYPLLRGFPVPVPCDVPFLFDRTVRRPAPGCQFRSPSPGCQFRSPSGDEGVLDDPGRGAFDAP